MARFSFHASGLIGAVVCLAAPLLAQDTPAAAQAPPPAASQPAPATDPVPQTQPAAGGAPPAAPGRRLTLLDLRRLELELGFEATYDERSVDYDVRDRYPTLRRQVNRAWSFEETLGLRSAGAFLGPDIMPFTADIRGGFGQYWFSEYRTPGGVSREEPDGDVLEYDFNLDFFPRGKLSGNAFASREQSRVPRQFQPSLDRSRERYGAGLFINDPVLPMRFTFEHVWDELHSRTWELQDDERRGDDTFRYEATWQIDKYHSLRLDYEYNDRSEQYSGTRTKYDTIRNYLTLNHQLRFGEDHRSTWENLLRFQDESGDLARDVAEFSSRVRFQHTKELATNFAAQFLRDSFEELTTTTWRGEGGLSWQPVEALITTAQFYGYELRGDQNSDFFEMGALLNASYAQDNALGRLTANASYNHISTDTRDGTRTGIVIGESVTFRDPLLVYLAQADVEWGTIIVTDAARKRTYLPGRDYATIRLGRYTALRRLATGQITDRETVLVSYTYKVADDYDIQRDRVDLRVQQEFKNGLAVYYSGALQDERIEQQTYLPFRDRNINRHRVGATWRKRRWTLGAEYEYNDDSIDPYQALHANAEWMLLQDARQQFDARTNLSYFDFRGYEGLTARDALVCDVGGVYRYLIARDLEATASALYRYEDDTLYGITNGVDVSSTLDWHLGYFDLRFEAEYDLLDVPGSSDNGFSFWLKLRRTIPLIDRAPAP